MKLSGLALLIGMMSTPPHTDTTAPKYGCSKHLGGGNIEQVFKKWGDLHFYSNQKKDTICLRATAIAATPTFMIKKNIKNSYQNAAKRFGASLTEVENLLNDHVFPGLERQDGLDVQITYKDGDATAVYVINGGEPSTISSRLALSIMQYAEKEQLGSTKCTQGYCRQELQTPCPIR
ncbi:TPA: hypothetical protein HA278_05220 [Candidatus Woesearchaeota archaeon]|nr:hypothetical protein [archaeon]HIJ11431.1 hypothetical protein [Candidatus Woesearchaeota archaeon]|tara:strand:+ start:452 stop:982 length:531 start_codon:yes stop_codon:yes gene_type:complete